MNSNYLATVNYEIKMFNGFGGWYFHAEKLIVLLQITPNYHKCILMCKTTKFHAQC